MSSNCANSAHFTSSKAYSFIHLFTKYLVPDCAGPYINQALSPKQT